MENKFQKALKLFEDKREENLQKLVVMSHDKLKDLKKYYSERHTCAEEAGYTESAEINYLHYRTVCDAIEIKRGNEEEIWDYLT